MDNFAHYDYYPLQYCISILRAIRSSIEGDWLQTQKQILNAEIFEDFLEMTEYLLNEGYKDPAAVIAGSVLERHIKQLCQNHDIPILVKKDGKAVPLRADTLNTELYKKNIYNLSDQKQIVAWLGIRNDAAHGNYGQYNDHQVKLMVQGIRNFTARIY